MWLWIICLKYVQHMYSVFDYMSIVVYAYTYKQIKAKGSSGAMPQCPSAALPVAVRLHTLMCISCCWDVQMPIRWCLIVYCREDSNPKQPKSKKNQNGESWKRNNTEKQNELKRYGLKVRGKTNRNVSAVFLLIPIRCFSAWAGVLGQWCWGTMLAPPYRAVSEYWQLKK